MNHEIRWNQDFLTLSYDVLLLAKRHRVVIDILDRLVRSDEIHHVVLLRSGAVPEAHERHTAFDIEGRVELDMRRHRGRMMR
jgi:hypothetical protein